MNRHQAAISISGKDLTLEQVIAVARDNVQVKIANKTKKDLPLIRKKLDRYVEQKLRELKKEEKKLKELEEEEKKLTEEKRKELDRLRQIERKRKMIYGVTTGFGELKTNCLTEPDEAKKLQKKIVLSHACGVGTDFDRVTTRAIMLLRANTLASGYCGISLEVLEQLVNFLNHDIYPSIPEQGSVGASGDLAPLAHLALGLINKAPVTYVEGDKEKPFTNLAQLKKKYPELDINPNLKLGYKEGLALVNGLAVTTGIGVLACADAENLVEWADTVGAVTLESVVGSSRAFDKIVFKKTVYGHKGAGLSAERVRDMIRGSKLINRSSEVHDAYSVRCIPQVHGAVRDALGYVRTTLDDQLNSVDDDPIIFSDKEIDKTPPLDSIEPPKGTSGDEWKKRKHYEQGNFHGEPVAFAMDMLAIVVAELGNISERRIQMLLDGNHNRGLPSCLVDNREGTNSGYMIAQYTAAALVSENKILSHPASVDSIPTSANTEDHVSMGTIAARKARKVIENVKNILAIELLCATEALSFRLRMQKITDPKTKLEKYVEIIDECGKRTRRLYDKVRGEADSLPHLNGNDVISVKDSKNGEDKEVFLYQLIKRANKEFLSKSPSDVISNQTDV